MLRICIFLSTLFFSLTAKAVSFGGSDADEAFEAVEGTIEYWTEKITSIGGKALILGGVCYLIWGVVSDRKIPWITIATMILAGVILNYAPAIFAFSK